MRAGGRVGAAAVSLFTACSLTTSFDELTGGGGGGFLDASDRASAEGGGEAATDATAGDAPLDTGPALPNLHAYGTFEDGCKTWLAFQGAATDSSVAHSGALACRFCGATSPDFTADDKSALPPPVVGAEYVARAWVRAPAAPSSPPKPGVRMYFRTTNLSPTFAEVQTSAGPLVTLGDAWVQIEGKLTVTKPAQHLNVVVVGYNDPQGACFLLDDVELFRTK